jgi:hypothetical protein
MEGVNPTKIYLKNLCKYHNVPPVQLLHTNKKNRWYSLEAMPGPVLLVYVRQSQTTRVSPSQCMQSDGQV